MITNENSVFRPSRNAAYRRIDDDVVIVDTAQNTIMTLNATGSTIWMALDGKSVRELADIIVETFDVEIGQALEDTIAFLKEMECRGLITT